MVSSLYGGFNVYKEKGRGEREGASGLEKVVLFSSC